MAGRSRDSDRGLSLVEVLVSLPILVVGAAGLAQLFTLAAAANAAAAHVTDATVLAVRKVEELRARPALAAPEDRIEYIDRAGEAAPASEATYTRLWTVAPLVADPSGMLLVVEVVVRARRVPAETRLITVRAVSPP
jgi:Tfp pilus assembly protein PilV